MAKPLGIQSTVGLSAGHVASAICTGRDGMAVLSLGDAMAPQVIIILSVLFGSLIAFALFQSINFAIGRATDKYLTQSYLERNNPKVSRSQANA
jgi:uncharacterized protein (DUF697 family)